MQHMLAITGTLFFLVFCISIIVFGNEAARNVAIFSAFTAGLSQFVAQDNREAARVVSIVLAYLSMIFSLVAFAMMASQS